MRVGIILLVAVASLAMSAYAIYHTNYMTYIMWSSWYTLDEFGFTGIAVTKEPNNFRRLGSSCQGGYPRRASARYID